MSAMRSKHDRQIPRNALRPQTRLRARATQNCLRGGTQGRRGIDHMSGESLKQPRLRPRSRQDDATAPDACVHASVDARVESCRVAMLVDDVEQRLHGWRRRSSSKATRTVAPGATRMRRRIENIGSSTAPDRVGKRPTVHDRDRRADGMAAAEESRPVGLEFRCADGLAIDDGQMRGPDFGLVGRPPSPGREDRADIGEDIRFRRTISRRRDARRRRSAAPGQVRHRR